MEGILLALIADDAFSVQGEDQSLAGGGVRSVCNSKAPAQHIEQAL